MGIYNLNTVEIENLFWIKITYPYPRYILVIIPRPHIAISNHIGPIMTQVW